MTWTADTWIALFLILMYFALLLGIGVWAAKRIKNSEDYILAGRSLGFWIFVLLLITSICSGVTLIGGSGMGFTYGWPSIWDQIFVPLSAVFCMETQAQFANLMMNKTRKSRAEKSNIPTTVKSDSMDIDLAKDKIILLGNVEVDDPEMNIKCQKMTIFLENKPTEQPAGDAGKSRSDAGSDMNPEGNKQVTRIECVGDVVITRNSGEKVAGSNVQKAFAGKAVYDLPADTITLTENNPVIVSGGSRLSGEQIIVDIKTERINVLGRVSVTAEGGLLKN